MRGGFAGIAFASGALLALVAPAALLADTDRVAPRAALEVTAESVRAGLPVTLDARESRGEVATVAWDLDGDGDYETAGERRLTLEHLFAAPGPATVGVRLTDSSGAADEATLDLYVAAAPAPPREDAALAAGEDLVDDEPAAPAEDRAAEDDDARPAPRASGDDEGSGGGGGSAGPSARAAATTTVTITDFEFTPATVNIAVGDTVTWRNNGPTVHTATASDDSFDTGNLNKGESGSHTFDTAGTFNYICTPHPFMKGTVKVGESGGGSGGGGSGGDSGGGTADQDTTGTDTGTTDTTGSGSDSSGEDSSLPETGSDIRVVATMGLLLMLLGAALRRRTGWRRL